MIFYLYGPLNIWLLANPLVIEMICKKLLEKGQAARPVHVFEEVVEIGWTGGQYHFVGPEGARPVFHRQPDVTEIGVVSKVTESRAENIFRYFNTNSKK